MATQMSRQRAGLPNIPLIGLSGNLSTAPPDIYYIENSTTKSLLPVYTHYNYYTSLYPLMTKRRCKIEGCVLREWKIPFSQLSQTTAYDYNNVPPTLALMNFYTKT